MASSVSPLTAKPARVLVPVLAIVFADTAGLGLILPLIPSLMARFGQGALADAARTGGYLLFTYALAQFLFAPMTARLSDRLGRRPVLIVTATLLAIDYLAMAAAETLFVLFVTRFAAGVLGASYAAANSAMADITPPDRRAAAFGMIGAAAGLGLISGPAFGALLVSFGDRVPFQAASALLALTAVLATILLPETLPAERRSAFRWAEANPLGSFAAVSRWSGTGLLVAANFLAQLAAQGQVALWAFFTSLVLGWSVGAIGSSIAFYGFLIAMAQLILPGAALRATSPCRSIVGAFLLGASAYLILATANSTPAVIFSIVVGAAAAAAFPLLKGEASGRAPPTAQGQLQGALASSDALAAALGPLLMTAVFASATDFMPGAPFLASALLSVLAAVAVRVSFRRAGEAERLPTEPAR